MQASDDVETPLKDTTAHAVFIDPAAYAQTHNLAPLTEGLRSLAANSVALDPDLADMMRVKIGDTAIITVGEQCAPWGSTRRIYCRFRQYYKDISPTIGQNGPWC